VISFNKRFKVKF